MEDLFSPPRHPLQRFASPARPVSFVVHLAGVGSFLASFAYLAVVPLAPIGSMGGSFQYLTNIGLALSLATFSLGYVADLALVPQLFAAKNALAVCAAPLEVLISLLYWGLRAIDPNLVIPPDLDFELPLLPDLGFHLAPALFLVADLLLFSPPWTIQMQSAGLLSLSLAFSYWAWIEFCFSVNGFYPYPIFELLSTGGRVLLFAFSALLMTGSTAFLKWLYHVVNGVEKSVKRE